MINAFITEVKANQKNVFFVLKIAISLGVIGYLYYSFQKDQRLYKEVFILFGNSISEKSSWELWLCLGLMPLNWSLEALKWKFLAAKIEKISFLNAFKGTLAGLGLGFITPQAVGDYAARIYFLNLKNKMEALGAILLGRVAMFLVAVFYGIIGFYILSHFQILKASRFLEVNTIFAIGIFSFIILILIINFRASFFIPQRFKSNTWVQALWNSLKILTQYDFSELSICFLISVARYLVFTFQYLLLLHIFKIDIFNILTISAVWMIYFVKSVFPTFNFLNDLGVREISAIYFFSELGISSTNAVLSSLLLWLINILVPTLAGTIILLFARYRT